MNLYSFVLLEHPLVGRHSLSWRAVKFIDISPSISVFSTDANRLAMSYYDDRLSPRRTILTPYNPPVAGPPVTPTRPQPGYPTQYSNPSQYSHPGDSYYSNDMHRATSPSPYQSHATAPLPTPIAAHEMTAYHQPSPMQPRPSFNSQHSDWDDSKSTTHLASPQKEWEVDGYVPPVPQSYPPQPSPLPTPGYTGTSHWHNMRNQLLERRVVQQIPLHNGNLVMDVPVPKGVTPSTTGLGTQEDEMTSMRYSAATCDPDEFMARKFTLRPYLYGRQTELFVSPLCS